MIQISCHVHEKLARFHFLYIFQANKYIWVSLIPILRANLQSTKESDPETSFKLLLDRSAGLFFSKLPLCTKNLHLVYSRPYALGVVSPLIFYVREFLPTHISQLHFLTIFE